jgi:ribosomal protein S1
MQNELEQTGETINVSDIKVDKDENRLNVTIKLEEKSIQFTIYPSSSYEGRDYKEKIETVRNFFTNLTQQYGNNANIEIYTEYSSYTYGTAYAHEIKVINMRLEIGNDIIKLCLQRTQQKDVQYCLTILDETTHEKPSE